MLNFNLRLVLIGCCELNLILNKTYNCLNLLLRSSSR
ncbi:hypothetical protein GLYMA_08G017051v4 [Glycine max]|nr:hypothetical protein GLYMA_08G017051v4 [Glycine max]KAH1049141.1 hypothetical protein GYH30_019944 [Glycine max]